MIHVTTARLNNSGNLASNSAMVLPPGDYVQLEVSDTGCGMTELLKAKIFDPFFSTKFAGRGLGLGVVQGIVRGHGGTIDLKSSPGEGTTFQVFLPCAALKGLREAPQRTQFSLVLRKPRLGPGPFLWWRMNKYCDRPSQRRSERAALW